MSRVKHILYIAGLSFLPLSFFASAAQAQDAPQTLGQSGWVKPSQSNSGLGQSGWVQPGNSAPKALGQSNWVRPGQHGGVPIALGQSGWIQPSEQQMQAPPPVFQGNVQEFQQGPFQQPFPQQAQGQQQFFQQPQMPIMQEGMAPMMGGPMMGGPAMGAPMMMGNNMPTDNFGKALGIASQLGIDMNQCDTTSGAPVGCTNYTQQGSGMRMPYIPGTQMFNRTADRASRTADRALNRMLNRAINRM